jgi:REP element-mobilizing transposase RayT
MGVIVSSWKTFTANFIGKLVRLPDKPQPHIWHKEFWDRYIRNENHLAAVRSYIHNNPVKAGLVADAAEWRWSSCWKRL